MNSIVDSATTQLRWQPNLWCDHKFYLLWTNFKFSSHRISLSLKVFSVVNTWKIYIRNRKNKLISKREIRSLYLFSTFVFYLKYEKVCARVCKSNINDTFNHFKVFSIKKKALKQNKKSNSDFFFCFCREENRKILISSID